MFNMRLDHLLKTCTTMMLTHALFTHTSIHAHLDELNIACEPYVESLEDALPTCDFGTDPDQEMKYIMQPVLNISGKTSIKDFSKAYVECQSRIIKYAQGCLGYPMDLVLCKELFENAKIFVHERYPEAALDVFDLALECIETDQANRFQ